MKIRHITVRRIAQGGAATLIAAAAALGASSASNDSAARLPKPLPLASPYQILMTRSMFARDHRSASHFADPPRRPDFPPPPPAEASYVLKGVGAEDGLFTAFFEQTQERRIVKVHSGENVARGKIAAITLDGIDFVMGSNSSHIGIGQSLSGSRIGPTTQPSQQDSGKSGSLTGDKPSWWHH